MASSRKAIGLKIAALLAVALVVATPAYAGLDKGAATVDSTIVYLGVIPAAATGNSTDRMGDAAMGGRAAANLHNIHLVVALFDRGTGKRITDAHLNARFLGERGRRWSLMLRPMVVDGRTSWGGYANLGADENASIFIDVVRPFGRGSQKLSARFEYSHD